MMCGFKVDLPRYSEKGKKTESVNEPKDRRIEIDYTRGRRETDTIDLVADLGRKGKEGKCCGWRGGIFTLFSLVLGWVCGRERRGWRSRGLAVW